MPLNSSSHPTNIASFGLLYFPVSNCIFEIVPCRLLVIGDSPFPAVSRVSFFKPTITTPQSIATNWAILWWGCVPMMSTIESLFTKLADCVWKFFWTTHFFIITESIYLYSQKVPYPILCLRPFFYFYSGDDFLMPGEGIPLSRGGRLFPHWCVYLIGGGLLDR